MHPSATEEIRLAVDVPSGLVVEAVALEAKGRLHVGAGVHVTAGSELPIGAVAVNLGDTATILDPGVRVGSVLSEASVVLRPRARVDGDVTSAGSVRRLPGARVTGTVNELTPIPVTNDILLRLSVPAPSADRIVVPPRRVESLAPAAYGSVHLRPGSRARLTAGEYFFQSLEVHAKATLEAEPGSGVVRVHVLKDLELRGEVSVADDDASRMLVTYLGSQDVRLQGPIAGTVVAPRARLEIQPLVPPREYRGAFFAKDLHVLPGTRIAHSPFDWGVLRRDVFTRVAPAAGPSLSTWPMFGAFLRRTALSTLSGPSVDDVQWEAELGGLVRSSPVVASDGTIYVGSDAGALFAIGPDGAVRWEAPLGGPVRSTPAVARDGTVYVGSADAHLHAVHPNGNKRWAFATGGPVVSSPGIAPDGTVVFGSTDGRVYGLRSDGTERWRFDTGSAVRSSPAIASGIAYIGSDALYALDVGTGALRWRTALDGGDVRSTPAIGADGTIYVGSDAEALFAVSRNG